MTAVKDFADYLALLLDDDVTDVEPSPFLDEIGMSVNDEFDGDDVINAITSELTQIGEGSRTVAYEYEKLVICVCESGNDAWKDFCVNYHKLLPHLPEMYGVKAGYQHIYVTKYYNFLENAGIHRVNDWSTVPDNDIRVPLENLYNSFGYEGSVYTAMVGDNEAEFHNRVDTEDVNCAMFTNAIDMLELFCQSHPLLKTLFIGLKHIADDYGPNDMMLDCLPCNICVDDDEKTLLLYDMVVY